MNLYIETVRRFNRNLRLFYVATAIQGFVFFGIYTLLLNLYLLRLGYGPQFIGTVNGVGPLMLAFGSLPAGLISKRIGGRIGLMIGFSGIALGFGTLPLGGFLPTAITEVWIVAAYAFAWLAASMMIVNAAPFIMTQTGEAERDHAFALYSGIFPVFGFLGSFIGGFLPQFFANLAGLTLESPIPYRNTLILGASLFLLPAFLMWLTSETDIAQKEAGADSVAELKEKSKPPIRLMASVAIVSLLVISGDWTAQLYLNVYLDTILKVPTSLIGSILGTARLLGLTALIAPLIMGRLGHRRTIISAAVAASLTFLPLILIGHWIAAGVSFMALLAAFSILTPTYNRYSQSLVEPEWRTTMASVVAMATGAAVALTAFGGAAIIETFGFQALFITGATLILTGAILFGLFFRD